MTYMATGYSEHNRTEDAHHIERARRTDFAYSMAACRKMADLGVRVSAFAATVGKARGSACLEYRSSVDLVGRSLGIQEVETGMRRCRDLPGYVGEVLGCSGGLDTIWIVD